MAKLSGANARKSGSGPKIVRKNRFKIQRKSQSRNKSEVTRFSLQDLARSGKYQTIRTAIKSFEDSTYPLKLSQASIAMRHGAEETEQNVKVRLKGLLQQKKQPEMTLLSILQSKQFEPVRTTLMSMLDTKDLLNLSRTSFAFRQGLKKTVWNINVRLERFFQDPVAFRTQIGQSNALISGGFALQFFRGVTWKESGLDIMVEKGNDTEDMEAYLLKEIMESRTYHSISPGEGQKVQLISTKSIPVQAILVDSSSTCVVNFISWNKAFSMFPRPTFFHHQTLPLRGPQIISHHLAKHYAKYSKRGWPMWTHPVITQSCWKMFKYRHDNLNDHFVDRRVGDRDSWIMKLDTRGVTSSPTPDLVLEYSCFEITMGQHQQTTCSIRATDFFSHVLRYRYTDGYVLYRLEHIFERSTKLQLFKFSEKDRPQFSRDEETWWKKFDKPDGWDYLDENLPQYFAEYERDPEFMRNLGYY
ncbi:hypothetical protein F5Y16DRAFT_414797 [Xylariaceae sp. FL0255]|nr:hypothetical protein F5Y16DRAFT_414797 [Xylariaceae sp. FL0255]